MAGGLLIDGCSPEAVVRSCGVVVSRLQAYNILFPIWRQKTFQASVDTKLVYVVLLLFAIKCGAMGREHLKII